MHHVTSRLQKVNHLLQETATYVYGRQLSSGGIIFNSASFEFVNKSGSSRLAHTKIRWHIGDAITPSLCFLEHSVGQNWKLNLREFQFGVNISSLFSYLISRDCTFAPSFRRHFIFCGPEPVMMIIVTRIDDSFSRVVCILILSPHICDEDYWP